MLQGKVKSPRNRGTAETRGVAPSSSLRKGRRPRREASTFETVGEDKKGRAKKNDSPADFSDDRIEVPVTVQIHLGRAARRAHVEAGESANECLMADPLGRKGAAAEAPEKGRQGRHCEQSSLSTLLYRCF